MKNKKSRVTLFDDDIYEVEEIVEESDDDILLNESIQEEEVRDDEPTLSQVYDLLIEIKSMLTSNSPVVEDADCVKKSGMGDDEDEIEEIKEEVVEDDDIEKDIEVDEDIIEDGDEELLDADEIVNEEELIAKSKDAKTVYRKFSRIGDTRSNVIPGEIQQSWQNRYDNIANKNY